MVWAKTGTVTFCIRRSPVLPLTPLSVKESIDAPPQPQPCFCVDQTSFSVYSDFLPPPPLIPLPRGFCR